MNHDGEQRDQYDQYDQSHRHDHCVTFRLPGHPKSVARAREILHRDFGLLGESGDTAALLLSELVTNALRHGSPPGREVAVTLHHSDGLFRLEVEDAGDHLPRPRIPELDDECGRGLALVAALADDWGVAPRRGPGKRVWVMIKVTGPAGPLGSGGPGGPGDRSGPAGPAPVGPVTPSGPVRPADRADQGCLAHPPERPERSEPPDVLERALRQGR